jgi:hypothetical protein
MRFNSYSWFWSHPSDSVGTGLRDGAHSSSVARSFGRILQHLLRKSGRMRYRGFPDAVLVYWIYHGYRCCLRHFTYGRYNCMETTLVSPHNTCHLFSNLLTQPSVALSLQVIPPCLVFVGCFFIPESPRWLASRDRLDKATKIIYKYHGGPDNEVAKLEIREITEHIKNSKPVTAGDYIRGLWDYRELFATHSARWRTAMVTLITLASTLTGNTILTCKLIHRVTVDFGTNTNSLSASYVRSTRYNFGAEKATADFRIVHCVLCRCRSGQCNKRLDQETDKVKLLPSYHRCSY